LAAVIIKQQLAAISAIGYWPATGPFIVHVHHIIIIVYFNHFFCYCLSLSGSTADGERLMRIKLCVAKSSSDKDFVRRHFEE